MGQSDFERNYMSVNKFYFASNTAGTTLLERCLYLERCRDVMLRGLHEHRIPEPEMLDARRLGFRLGHMAVSGR